MLFERPLGLLKLFGTRIWPIEVTWVIRDASKKIRRPLLVLGQRFWSRDVMSSCALDLHRLQIHQLLGVSGVKVDANGLENDDFFAIEAAQRLIILEPRMM